MQRLKMRHPRRYLRSALQGAIALYGLGLSAAIMLSLLPIDAIIIEFAITLAFVLLPLAPLALIVWLFVRDQRVLLALSVPLLAWMLALPQQMLDRRPGAPPNAPQISIMTYNLLTRDYDIDVVIERISAADADVVSLQELSVEVVAVLERELAQQYPHQALHGQDGRYNYFRGQGILSKYPIIEDEYWQFEDLPESHGQQRALIAYDDTNIVIYNVHPWPPFEWFSAGGIGFPAHVEYAHHAAIERLIDRATAEDAPVILLGDMNLSPYFSEYDDLTTHFIDSFGMVGRGAGYTYPACGFGPFGALIRLDYIFHSVEWLSLEAQVLEGCHPSDHHPVMARLALVG